MMLFPRAALLLAVVALVSVTDQAEARKNKKGKKEHTFHGVVVDVDHTKGGKHGTITVKHHRHRQQNAGQQGAGKGAGKVTAGKRNAGQQVGANAAQGSVEKTFTITGRTHVHSTGQGKAGGKLHKGAHVVIHYHGDHADVIHVLHKSASKQKK